jgi:hypothetical protein
MTRNLEESLGLLLREEGLDRFDELLCERTWDEVPLWSRTSRLQFLSGMSPVEQSGVLVRAAVAHLGRIYDWVLHHPERSSTLLLVSVTSWDDLEDTEPMPVVPCFWISSNPDEFANIRFRTARSERGLMVKDWLGPTAGEFWILESASERGDQGEPARIYLARRDRPPGALVDVRSLILDMD